MNKTKLGVTVGALGASTFFLAYFFGYLSLAIVAGYILLVEENIWLRRIALKAVILTIVFELLFVAISFIPETVGVIDSFANLFSGEVSIPYLSRCTGLLSDIVGYARMILFIALGFQALRQRTIIIAPIDNAVEKYIEQTPVR